MIWAALVAAIVLLLLFPKKMGLVLGLLISIFIAIVVYIKLDESSRKAQIDAVSIDITYGNSNCSFAKPLNVRINNGSQNTLKTVRWNVSAYQPGYSANMVDNGKRSGPNSAPYENRLALAPNETASLCYALPALSDGASVSELTWEVASKQVVFE